MKRIWRWTLVALLAMGVGLVLARGSWQAYLKQRAETKQSMSEMSRAEAERNALLRERARLESAAGREEFVRSHNFRKFNERPLEAR